LGKVNNKQKSRENPESLHFSFLFLRGEPGLNGGKATRFAKAPSRISAFLWEANRGSQHIRFFCFFKSEGRQAGESPVGILAGPLLLRKKEGLVSGMN
jgi:hypothetical protein